MDKQSQLDQTCQKKNLKSSAKQKRLAKKELHLLGAHAKNVFQSITSSKKLQGGAREATKSGKPVISNGQLVMLMNAENKNYRTVNQLPQLRLLQTTEALIQKSHRENNQIQRLGKFIVQSQKDTANTFR